jgi:hypothetical protein
LCQVFKNERQNHMEKPATAQAKEETTHSWRVRDIGAPAIVEILPGPTGKEEMAIRLRLLRECSLKKEPMWHADPLPSNNCVNRRQ